MQRIVVEGKKPQRAAAYAENRREQNIALVSRLPHDTEIEATVLGTVLIEPNKFSEVAAIIPAPGAFYDDRHRQIWEAMLRLEKSGAPVDLLTVSEEIRKMGILEAIGGAYYLTQMTMSVTSSAHVEAHARLIVEKYLLREAISLGHQTIAAAQAVGADCFEVLDEAFQALTSLSIGNGTSSYSSAAQVAKVGMDELERILKGGQDTVTGVPTGYKRLNEITCGWQPGDLIIVAARPAVGKTAFVQNLALGTSRDEKDPTPVGFFSLEMSKKQLIKRYGSIMGRVDGEYINRGLLDPTEAERYMRAMNDFAKLPIYVDDSARIDLRQLTAKARRMRQKEKVRLIIVDYLQLMSGSGKKGGNREQEVSEISRGLKILAKELDVAVIALSQLNRGVENRKENKDPQLSDLRESGAIEQDADMVMFLSRPDYGNELEADPALKDKADIHIAKSRMGKVAKVPMYFVKDYQLWLDAAGYDRFNSLGSSWSFTPVGADYATMRDAYARQARDPGPMEADDDQPF